MVRVCALRVGGVCFLVDREDKGANASASSTSVIVATMERRLSAELERCFTSDNINLEHNV